MRIGSWLRSGCGRLIVVVPNAHAASRQIAVETGVINIEVPVRVFSGGNFVDDLKIGDFEILESGRPVPLDAVYLVRGRTVERSDEVRRFTPRTNRSFYLFFEISEFKWEILSKRLRELAFLNAGIKITLVDEHHVATHLDKDQTWPDCSVFQKDEVLDFHLARSEKTLFLSYEKTAWWRKSM